MLGSAVYYLTLKYIWMYFDTYEDSFTPFYKLH
jgi:hypothetical protein